MRTLLIDQDIPLSENTRLVKRLWKVDKSEDFPEGVEFAYQFLYFKNKWIQVARFDNQMHEGKPGLHIHILKREKMQWKHIAFENIEERIIELGESVIKNIIERK